MSILLQLRTGHAPLCKHLHKLERHVSPMCPYCKQEEETVQHFLVKCPALVVTHNRFFFVFLCDFRKVSFLLTNLKAMKQVVKFALASKCFKPTPALAQTASSSSPPSQPTPDTPTAHAACTHAALAAHITHRINPTSAPLATVDW
jgi:hypothetical protein